MVGFAGSFSPLVSFVQCSAQAASHADTCAAAGSMELESPATAAPAPAAPAGAERRDHELTVRDATREDMPTILAMIHELAAYEGMPDGPRLTAADLIADGFDSSPPWFSALVAERCGEPVGYAIVNRAYSSWTRRALYLEDLYVRPDARRAGVGRRLLRALARRAAALRVSRLDWHVLEHNAPARAFYAALGARDLRVSEGRTAMRLDEPHILRLADEA